MMLNIATLLSLVGYALSRSSLAGTSETAPSVTAVQTTAVTSCHPNATQVFCIDGGGNEVRVVLEASPTGDIPPQYTGCHMHGEERYCQDSAGEDVRVVSAEEEHHDQSHPQEHEHEHEHDHDHDHDHNHNHAEEVEMDCHFHAGVEHCVPVGGTETGSASVEANISCRLLDRSYDIPLRISTLFVVLVTSAAGVFLPMLLGKISFISLNGIVFTAIKQFGTGIIVSTAFVHLYTHAYVMFSRPCLGRLQYEATTSAIVMAGIFMAWLVEYASHRVIVARSSNYLPTHVSNPETSGVATPESQDTKVAIAKLGHNHGNLWSSSSSNTKLSVIVMEAGILFHSILIGLTLVVAGDSFYKTLLVVIVFHQLFEGLALGARISLLPGRILWQKFAMGAAFALITPIGMATGLGVLRQFNGNDRATIITIGTLDAVSAGILIWVGVVEMWARDWIIEGGDLLNAKMSRVLTGGVSLIAGLVLMSLLGKWV